MKDKKIDRFMNKASEAWLYLIISQFDHFIQGLNNTRNALLAQKEGDFLGKIRSVDEEISNLIIKKNQAIDQTARFGVIPPRQMQRTQVKKIEFKGSKRIEKTVAENVFMPSAKFHKWYRFWILWIENLSPNQKTILEQCMMNQIEIPKDMLPDVKWNQIVKTNGKKVIIPDK